MKKRVLVLDDDLDVLEAIATILVYENFEVTTIGRTYNIFKSIDDYKPDIILLDHILEGLTGGEICKQLKSNPSTSNIPVIIISAYKVTAEMLNQYGCDHFIPKPFGLSDLLEGINSTLEKAAEKSNQPSKKQY